MGIDVNDLPKHIQAQIAAKTAPQPTASKNHLARAAAPTGRKMNKWETQYAAHLTNLVHSGDIVSFQYEALKFRLADYNTYYTPDFIVLNKKLNLEVHEVKGHWEDDARVKIKVAKTQFPYMVFFAVTKKNGAWSYERIS